MRTLRAWRPALFVLVALGAAPPAPAASKPELTLAEARRVSGLASAEAKRLGAPGAAIAIVDDGGHLLHLERLDGTFPAAAQVATEKARTAAIFRKQTADFEAAVNGGRVAFLGNDAATPLQGGVPILINGSVVGAIGVSGAASAQQDQELAVLAAAGAGAVSAAAAAEVTQLDSARVRAAFAKGAPLLENGLYKIHASRRDAPGQAEVHVRDTDVLYVLEGSATLVTGGRVAEGAEIAPDEIRGPRIEGGMPRALSPGQVVVVPNGTPHWFESVRGPFVYYVVKVTAGGE
jgi:glc operon protein GlcG